MNIEEKKKAAAEKMLSTITPECMGELRKLPVLELTPENLEWIEGLESEEFEQGQQNLNKGGKMCCLGVLCEQWERRGKLLKSLEGYGAEPYFYYRDLEGKHRQRGCLPIVVKVSERFRGLLGDFGINVTTVHGEFDALAFMNDSGHFDFFDIAWLIRTYPSLIFKLPGE